MYRLPERGRIPNRRQAVQGLDVVTDAIAIPALHRQLLQRGVVNDPLPAAAIADQQPVALAGVTGLGQADPAQLPQGAGGLKHPKTTTCRIPHLELIEGALQHEHLALVAGCTQAKPAQQHQPGPTEPRPPQQQHRAQADREKGEDAPGLVGYLHAPPLAATDLPHQGLDDQAAVEGQTGQQIEQGQHQVEAAELGNHRPQQRREMGCSVGSGQQTHAQQKADGRPRCSHQQGPSGRAAFPLHAGHTPQQKQGDAADLNALGQGNQGMAQFVQEN